MNEHGQGEDLSDLDSRFAPYFESTERVEVTWKDGHENWTGYGQRSKGRKARFYVGRSTGWRPVYIQLLRRDSIGGACILSDAVAHIRGTGIFRTPIRIIERWE